MTRLTGRSHAPAEAVQEIEARIYRRVAVADRTFVACRVVGSGFSRPCCGGGVACVATTTGRPRELRSATHSEWRARAVSSRWPLGSFPIVWVSTKSARELSPGFSVFQPHSGVSLALGTSAAHLGVERRGIDPVAPLSQILPRTRRRTEVGGTEGGGRKYGDARHETLQIVRCGGRVTAIPRGKRRGMTRA